MKKLILGWFRDLFNIGDSSFRLEPITQEAMEKERARMDAERKRWPWAMMPIGGYQIREAIDKRYLCSTCLTPYILTGTARFCCNGLLPAPDRE